MERTRTLLQAKRKILAVSQHGIMQKIGLEKLSKKKDYNKQKETLMSIKQHHLLRILAFLIFTIAAVVALCTLTSDDDTILLGYGVAFIIFFLGMLAPHMVKNISLPLVRNVPALHTE